MHLGLFCNKKTTHQQMQTINTHLSILFFLLIIKGNVYSQTCPSGNLSFSTQSQVDSFPIVYPNCNYLPGNLEISGSVLHLDSLYQLDSIYGAIKVIASTQLKNFRGLENLRYLGGELTAFNNDSLTNFEGLEGLKKLNYANISTNPGLRNLHGLDSVKQVISVYLINNGLDSITGLEGLDNIWNIIQILGNTSLKSLIGFKDVTIETLHIVDCDSLWDLEGLDNNITITRSLSIGGNDGLANLHGVEGFKSIPGSLQITANTKITTLSEFLGLHYVGEGLHIANNSSLVSLFGLDSLKKVQFGVGISDNDRLKDLDGMERLDTIGNTLAIRRNDSLISLSALSNLQYIGGTLHLMENKQIRSLHGLDSVKRTGGLLLRKNNKLNSIWALMGVKWISGELRIAENDSLASLKGLDSADLSSATDLFIYDSPILQFCAVQSICDYLASGKIAYILNNFPGCMDTVEVSSACASISVDEQLALGFEVYPNPSNGNFEVLINENFNPPYSMSLFDGSSQIVFEDKDVYTQKAEINMSTIAKGIYFLNLQDTDGNRKIQKLVIK